MKKYTAKTLDELLKNAANDKHVEINDLTYFVTEEKKGILGIGTSVSADVYCMDDVKEFIFNYLGEFFTELNQEIEVEIVRQNDGFKVMLNAENNAILIGKNGQTLQAMNTVLRGAVNSTFKKRIPTLIDINNYKTDRYAKVKAMAKRIARTVQKTKVEAVLDPMPNDERKVIHQFLGEMDHIKTESEGEGNHRHLKIMYDENKKGTTN
ncbi:protein jag [Anaerorhabdus furcosa]|uniref:SpoIIIJ-associated protein n=1 Tax=Anaerorhabdus furcosa TaxID=118967 RepID=A0A1T4KSD9_9FIRM|nr:R3H domain-containing nucleic acid-binding protein [Anaerorhabdus furcosa]SJZ45321.1 spoIIIJ-associated protein [Anaerorhabdus furcosa]